MQSLAFNVQVLIAQEPESLLVKIAELAYITVVVAPASYAYVLSATELVPRTDAQLNLLFDNYLREVDFVEASLRLEWA